MDFGAIETVGFICDTSVVNENVDAAVVVCEVFDGGGDGGVGGDIEFDKAECALWFAGLEVLETGLAFGDVADAHDNVVRWRGCR